jgi:hypothetical protein
LRLNLGDYSQYRLLELTVDKDGKWGAKPSSDVTKVLIRCVGSSAIEIAYRKVKVTVPKGTTVGPWTYR